MFSYEMKGDIIVISRCSNGVIVPVEFLYRRLHEDTQDWEQRAEALVEKLSEEEN
tara:strand:- start:578 stop:742 length:165 start_codon:yes stop_codon:yes gene_type:complete